MASRSNLKPPPTVVAAHSRIISEIVGKECHHSVRGQGRGLRMVKKPIRRLRGAMDCNRVVSTGGVRYPRASQITHLAVVLPVLSLGSMATDSFLKAFHRALKLHEVIRRSALVVALAYNWIPVADILQWGPVVNTTTSVNTLRT